MLSGMRYPETQFQRVIRSCLGPSTRITQMNAIMALDFSWFHCFAQHVQIDYQTQPLLLTNTPETLHRRTKTAKHKHAYVYTYIYLYVSHNKTLKCDEDKCGWICHLQAQQIDAILHNQMVLSRWI